MTYLITRHFHRRRCVSNRSCKPELFLLDLSNSDVQLSLGFEMRTTFCNYPKANGGKKKKNPIRFRWREPGWCWFMGPAWEKYIIIVCLYSRAVLIQSCNVLTAQTGAPRHKHFRSCRGALHQTSALERGSLPPCTLGNLSWSDPQTSAGVGVVAGA